MTPRFWLYHPRTGSFQYISAQCGPSVSATLGINTQAFKENLWLPLPLFTVHRTREPHPSAEWFSHTALTFLVVLNHTSGYHHWVSILNTLLV